MSDESNPQISKEQFIAFANRLKFHQLIGLETVDLAPGWSLSRIQYREDLTQPTGIMHGGIIATLIDTGIAHAILMTDAFQQVMNEGAAMVTVDLRVKYFRPVSAGIITCECTVPRIGRSLLHCEAVVRNEAGKDVARGDSTYMILDRTRLLKSEG